MPSPSDPEDGGWLAAAAEEQDAAWVVIDGYRFDAGYMRGATKPGRPVLAIDDDARHDAYPVTTVLNQNLHAKTEDYAGKTKARLLLGPRHALIRSEFGGWRGWERPIPPRAGKILVTLGGADPDGHTGLFIEAFRCIQKRSSELNPKVRVIVGAANPRLDALRATASEIDDIDVLSDVRDMGAQMRWCDMAISASGSTVWELALFQTPMLLATASRAEEPVARSLRDATAAKHLGRLDDLDVEIIVEAIVGFARDANLRSQLSKAASRIVDGKGAERVVDAMLSSGRPAG